MDELCIVGADFRRSQANRRLGSFCFVLVFSYPIFAESLPGPISGMASTPADTASYHVMSIESILGLPLEPSRNLLLAS